MTALERIRRRGRTTASLLMPLFAVVSINASAACVGMTADGAMAGFSKAVASQDEAAPHGLDQPSHDIELAHRADWPQGHEDSPGLDHAHGHDDPLDHAHTSHDDPIDHAHTASHDDSPGTGHAASHADLHHGHGDCPHCPTTPTGDIDSGHAVCSVAEEAVAAAAAAPAVQWDQKPLLAPIAWIAPPAVAPPARILDVSSQAAAVPASRSPQVRFCVLLL